VGVVWVVFSTACMGWVYLIEIDGLVDDIVFIGNFWMVVVY
jgi:hypothetical protein